MMIGASLSEPHIDDFAVHFLQRFSGEKCQVQSPLT